MSVAMYRLYRGPGCPGVASCGLCADQIPALAEAGGLLISTPSLRQHEQKIDDIVRACPTGAIALDEHEGGDG